jgi:hypothetical protein
MGFQADPDSERHAVRHALYGPERYPIAHPHRLSVG